MAFGFSCAFTPPAGWPGRGPVVFNYDLWAQRYPEFSQTVGAALAGMYFTEASMYLDNTACSPIIDNTPGGQRALLLNMLTAHIAALNTGTNGSAASALVGRISDATQGSVSVTADMGVSGPAGGSAPWYQQTKYGAAYWQATAGYRMGGRYFRGPQPYFGVQRPGPVGQFNG